VKTIGMPCFYLYQNCAYARISACEFFLQVCIMLVLPILLDCRACRFPVIKLVFVFSTYRYLFR